MSAPDLEPLARALRDMGIDGGVYRHDREFVRFLGPDGTPWSVWFPQDESIDCVNVIAQLQTSVSETDARWGEPVPRCPGHGHPVSPRDLDGELWWGCPASGARVARIGELPR